MAKYNDSVLCKHGRELLERALSEGVSINFVSVKTSSESFDPEDLPELESIGVIKQSKGIVRGQSVSSDGITLYTQFTNTELTQGYFVRNFGIYVNDPDNDGEELLYAIVTADESEGIQPAYLPAYVEGSGVGGIEFNCVVTVANANEVTVTLDPNAGISVAIFREHTDSSIASENGVHGLRYHDNSFAYKNGSQWIVIDAGGGMSYTVTTSEDIQKIIHGEYDPATDIDTDEPSGGNIEYLDEEDATEFLDTLFGK